MRCIGRFFITFSGLSSGAGRNDIVSTITEFPRNRRYQGEESFDGAARIFMIIDEAESNAKLAADTR